MVRVVAEKISGEASLLQATWNVTPLSAVWSPALKRLVTLPKLIVAVGVTWQAATSVAPTVTVLLLVPAKLELLIVAAPSANVEASTSLRAR
jgi:hypothetical protein